MYPSGTSVLLTLQDTVLLVLKFYFVFGLSFELPIVLVLLSTFHIITSQVLVSRWRKATVAIFIIAAIITPTWDPLTMTVCALPMCFLYLGTVGLIRLLERRRHRRTELAERLPSSNV